MQRILLLSISDVKQIFRDKSLRIFLAMPLLIFLIILVVVPSFTLKYPEISAYVPIVLMGATMQTSTMFGFIYSMVLIDEKDINVAKIYGILPVSKTGFIITRLLFPFLFSFVLTFVLLLMQPFYSLAVFPSLLVSVLCGLLAPLLTLMVTNLSKNKMEGMTWFKFANLLISVPFVAFFITKYEFLFGIIPTHWIFQTIDGLITHQSILFPLLIGFIFVVGLLALLIRRFVKIHFL